MDEVLLTNLAILREYRIDLYEKVLSRIEKKEDYQDYRWTVNRAANGSFNLVQIKTGIHMYSKYNPEHECARWAESIRKEGFERSDVIMYGVGLTHHLAAYLKLNPTHQIYLYEPDMDIFIESLKVISLNELLSNPNIRFLAVGQSVEELASLFYWFYTYSRVMGGVVAVPYYLKMMGEQTKTFAEDLKQHLLSFESSRQYSQKIGLYEQRNLLKNIKKVLSTPSLIHLRNLWRGKKAIIVGGGPSLERDLPLLAELQHHYVIIAAGTSILALLNYGIKPHLVVSIDAYKFNFSAFNRITMEDQVFLFTPTIESRILDMPGSMLVHAFLEHNKHYTYLFDLQIEEDPLFVGTHSVTGTAIQAASYLGIDTIIFTGQDLSYPNKKLYAAGVEHHSAPIVNYFSRQMTEMVGNVDGGHNATTVKMKMTLHDLENLIESIEGITFINCSQGGAEIRGTRHMKLSALEVPEIVYSRDQFNEEFRDLSRPYGANRVNMIVEKLARYKLWSEQLIPSVERVEKLLSNLELLSRSNPSKCMKTIVLIEETWGNIVKHENFNHLMEPVLKVALHEFDKMVPYVQHEQKLTIKSKLLTEALRPLLEKVKNRAAQLVLELNRSISEVAKV